MDFKPNNSNEQNDVHSYAEDEAERQLRLAGEWISEKFSKASLLDVLGIATNFALIIVGVIAACIYGKQLSEMKNTTTAANKAVAESNKNFLADQQARIAISFPAFNFRQEIVGIFFEVPMEITNTGKTAARKVEVKGDVSIVSGQNSDAVDLPPGDLTHGYTLLRFGLVQPNQTIKDWPLGALETSGKSKPVITTPDLIRHVNDATFTVVIHGRITYEDIFGYPHWLTFCTNANGLQGGSSRCFEYNDSDKAK